jgi:hypothetical protein
MNFLFWLCWILDLLLLGLLILGSGLRTSFGAGTNLNGWLTLLVVVVIIVSLILRFSSEQKIISLAVVAIPFILLTIMYLFEKMTK